MDYNNPFKIILRFQLRLIAYIRLGWHHASRLQSSMTSLTLYK